MVLAGQGIEFNFQAYVKLQDQRPVPHGTATLDPGDNKNWGKFRIVMIG